MAARSERVTKLREHALSNVERVMAAGLNTVEWRYFFEKGYIDSYSMEIHTGCRYAMAVQHMLEHVLPVIDERELLVGKPSGRMLTADEAAEWALIQKYSKPAKPRSDGQASHMAVDYELLLEKGAMGIIADIEMRMDALDIAIPEQLEQYSFYRSCVIALQGLINLANRYAAYSKELADQCADDVRKYELLKISEICERVPAYPARNFYEAVQSVHFLTFVLSASVPGGLYQLGRPDRYLYKYYRQDIDSGVITNERVQELIDCLGIIYNEYIPGGLAVGLMVGGRDANGNNIENELTHMFVESVRNVGMIYPGVGLCYTTQTSDLLLKLSCEVLSEGHSHPALFNDDVIIKGLEHYGLPYAEACEYIHSTCVEITPIKSSACWVASPYTNLPQLLLDTIDGFVDGCMCESQQVNYNTFEHEYFERLAKHIRVNLIEQNAIRIERTLHFYDPLLSCFVEDCLTNGTDIEHGGARYNWIMPSFVGIANAADAMHVINELVFKHRYFGLAELKTMLERDFEGYEAQRAMILNKVSKYGNDDDIADAYVTRIAEHIKTECEKYSTVRDCKLIPSLFCWIMHERFGSETNATPDGRKRGFPLGDGSGPAQGKERNGHTASVLSSTKWEHYPFIGGVAVNMKFSKKLFAQDSYDKLEALVKTFMERGGFELQVNVVDRETLLKARENPEQYADLVVRIGGYSDYFVRLSPAMQQEVIERSEHQI